MGQDQSQLLAYATPDLNVGPGNGHDRVINFSAGLQMIIAAIGLTLLCVGLAASRFKLPPPGVWPFLLQWPGYAVASFCAFLGSQLRWISSRRRFYLIYFWAFPVLVSIAELGCLPQWKEDRESCVTFLIAYPIVALVGNPVLIVMCWRYFRTARSATAHR